MFDDMPPIVFATLQACILNAASNIIAQVITAYKTDASYSIDWTSLVQFTIFTALNCPPNFLWQTFLESTFPSTYLTPSASAITAASTSNEKELDREQSNSEILESKLSIKNTVIKFMLDQTIGASVNTLMYLIGFGGISGKTWDACMLSVRLEFWNLIVAGWTLWPLVSIFNFAIIKSVEMRGLVGCLAGMAWGIFLSLKQSGPSGGGRKVEKIQ